MALDLARTVGQIDSLARRLHDRRDERADRLARTMAAMAGADAGELRRKLDSAPGRPFLCPGLVGGLSGRHQPAGLPRDFCVAATDGSHIDVDRHTPVRCYLINVGGCLLTYGSQPDARLFSEPVLYSEESDLYPWQRRPGIDGSRRRRGSGPGPEAGGGRDSGPGRPRRGGPARNAGAGPDRRVSGPVGPGRSGVPALRQGPDNSPGAAPRAGQAARGVP